MPFAVLIPAETSPSTTTIISQRESFSDIKTVLAGTFFTLYRSVFKCLSMSLASNPEKRADDSSCEKIVFFMCITNFRLQKYTLSQFFAIPIFRYFSPFRGVKRRKGSRKTLSTSFIIDYFCASKLIKNKPSDISTKSESSLSVILVTRKFFISNGPIGILVLMFSTELLMVHEPFS